MRLNLLSVRAQLIMPLNLLFVRAQLIILKIILGNLYYYCFIVLIYNIFINWKSLYSIHFYHCFGQEFSFLRIRLR